MTERRIPEGWSAGEASRIGDTSGFSNSPIAGNSESQRPEETLSGSRKKRLPNVGSNSSLRSIDWRSLHRSKKSRSRRVEEQASRLTPSGPIANGALPVNQSPKQRRSLPKNWMFWGALAGLLSGGLGFVSVALLLKLPAAPNCPAIFWPMASASVRVHCAQVAASKETVDDLLEAIALVQALPSNHSLRPEINRLLTQWSSEILALGDEAFQAGQLQEAIAIAQKIPQDVPAYQLVEQQIERWQSIWSQAEGYYQQAEAEMRQQHWHEAFMAATRLLNINNNYWATTKYDELNNQIAIAREDANKLAKAQSLATRGGLDNLLEAIKLVESIGTDSYIHQAAREALPEFGRKMLVLAQETLDRRDATSAIAIANKIPASTGLQLEAQDFVTVAEAQRSAWDGTVASLEEAIASAQKIASDRPLYNKAQELITRWQLEIEDVTHLAKARQFAQPGTVGDLTAAIAEAELIPTTNPRASEAKALVNGWRNRVETIQDQPYLERAEQLAALRDVNSLQAAIGEASQVSRGRALYPSAQSKIQTWTAKIQQIQDQPFLDRAEQLAVIENINSLQAAISEASRISRGRALYPSAQSKIRTWTQKMQRIQDQPYLNQARLLASSGDLSAAISAARQIRPGRVLAGEAQAAINDWQGQIQARQNWQQARQVALSGTPDALVEAIRLAQRVPTTSPLRNDVNPTIAQWSQQILSIAQDRGENDIPGAIAIAKLVPRGSDAYQAAQEQIDIWQKFLNPEQ